MRQVILTVSDEEYAPLMKVLKALPFVIKVKAVVAPKLRKPKLEQ